MGTLDLPLSVYCSTELEELGQGSFHVLRATREPGAGTKVWRGPILFASFCCHLWLC